MTTSNKPTSPEYRVDRFNPTDENGASISQLTGTETIPGSALGMILCIPKNIELKDFTHKIYERVCQCTGRSRDTLACARGEKNNEGVPDEIKSACREAAHKVRLQIAEGNYKKGVEAGIYPKDPK